MVLPDLLHAAGCEVTDKQARVIASGSLFLREEGRKDAALLAKIMSGTIVHLAGAVSSAGYAPAYVEGWLDEDGKTLRSDSLSRSISVDAILFTLATFTATGDKDDYGRTPGRVSGFLFAPLVRMIE